MSSNDFDGPYRPAGGRGADDSGGTRGAGAGGAGAGGAGGAGAGGAGAPGAGRHGAGSGGDGRGGGYARGNGRGRAGKYPDPEGWGDDGFWRDSSMDSDYETGLNKAVRTNGNSPRGDGGYSYWADGRGWKNSPGGGPAGSGPAGSGSRRHRGGSNGHGTGNGSGTESPTRMDSDATRMDSYATRMDSYSTRMDQGAAGFGMGGAPTDFYPGSPAPDFISNSDRNGPAGYPDGGRSRRGPGRGKVKGNWWRHWSWKKALAVAGSAFGIFLLIMVGTYYYMYDTTQIPTQPVADVGWQNSTVYYSDGKTPIGTFGDIHRQVLSYGQIPKIVDDAVMAAEDRSFMTEGGISPSGILRAAYEDVLGSGSLQGASTITQQFVRNYYQDIGTQQTISRKIKEVFVAMKLAKEKSKQWILTNYLNMIYLGTGAYGVGAAAQTYFHEPVGKLTVAQAAVIAAIIQAPTAYPQPQYRPQLTARWHYVLDGMVKMGDLTQAQADSMTFPAMYDTPEQSFGSSPWDPYVMNVVQNELEGIDHLTLQQLDTGGYKIVTTISRPMEAAMYKAVDENMTLIHQQGYVLPPYAMIGAELQNPANGAIVAMYPGRTQNMPPKQCQLYDCDLNTAVYAREQVGSSFKPYVLATAVSEGMNVKTSVLNASPILYVPPDTMPLMLSATSQARAAPGSHMFHNDAYAPIPGTSPPSYASTVQNALAQSSNTAYTDLAHRAGTSAIVKMAANMGVNIAPFPAGSNLSQEIGQVGMALGMASLTVNEQTSMLATIDDNGKYHSGHVVASYQAPTGPVVPGIVTTSQVLTPAQDSQVQYAMEATTVDGTGVNAAMTDGRPIIAKTGTTSNGKSAFFIGAIPQYSLVVGIFTQSQNVNSPQTLLSLGGGGYGGSWPASIWHTFAEMEFAKLPIMQFQTPVFTGAKWVEVPPQPKPKPKPKKTVCKSRSGCPTPPPGGHHHGHGPGPSPSPSPTQTSPLGGPTSSAAPSSSPSGNPSSSSSPPSGPPVKGSGGGVQAGLALGGILSVLPGSLLWTQAARRRRKRRRGAAR